MNSWDEIIQSIGEAEFESACAEARLHTRDVFTGKSGPSPTIAHEISDFIWKSKGESHVKLELAFRFYESMPCLSCESLVRRVLRSSGPVPFEWKETIYRELLPDQSRHEGIFRSLLHSRFDVYGRIDSKRALAILHELNLPDDTPHLALLRDTLAADTK